MRLDLYLVKAGLAPSRERAKEYILNGQVAVAGKPISKPSFDVSDGETAEIIGNTLKYVGRGGLKLEKALSVFNIDVKGRVCLDIGASTGGFTDCMLQNEAAYIYSVDVGHGQLAEKLLNDSRVCSMEGTNINDVALDDMNPRPDFVTADVSFVSLKAILPKIAEIILPNGEAAVLIKPQFEAGRSNIGKNGIVKNPKIHLSVLQDINAFCISIGLTVYKLDYSPISGGSGNIEYLAYIAPSGRDIPISFNAEGTVKSAFKEIQHKN